MAEKNKCTLCGERINTTFLDKLNGTIFNKKYVCSSCQKEHGEKLSEKLKDKSEKKQQSL